MDSSIHFRRRARPVRWRVVEDLADSVDVLLAPAPRTARARRLKGVVFIDAPAPAG